MQGALGVAAQVAYRPQSERGDLRGGLRRKPAHQAGPVQPAPAHARALRRLVATAVAKIAAACERQHACRSHPTMITRSVRRFHRGGRLHWSPGAHLPSSGVPVHVDCLPPASRPATAGGVGGRFRRGRSCPCPGRERRLHRCHHQGRPARQPQHQRHPHQRGQPAGSRAAQWLRQFRGREGCGNEGGPGRGRCDEGRQQRGHRACRPRWARNSTTASSPAR